MFQEAFDKVTQATLNKLYNHYKRVKSLPEINGGKPDFSFINFIYSRVIHVCKSTRVQKKQKQVISIGKILFLQVSN